jgi:putative acetyltransferase
MAFRIRDYDPADAPALARIFYDSVRTIGPRGYSPAQVETWAPALLEPERVAARVGDGRTTLVAVNADGEAVGYGDLEADGHLDHLYCRPDAVGKGVGSMLIEALVGLAIRQGNSAVYVEASEIARPVFERHGFAVLRRRDFEVRGVPIHNYAMEKALRPHSP